MPVETGRSVSFHAAWWGGRRQGRLTAASASHRLLELGQIEVVAPERDLAVTDHEEAHDGSLDPPALHLEAVGALVHHHVAFGDLMVHHPLHARAAAEERAKCFAQTLGSVHL